MDKDFKKSNHQVLTFSSVIEADEWWVTGINVGVPSLGVQPSLTEWLLHSWEMSSMGLDWGCRDGGAQWAGGEEEGDAGFTSPSTKAEQTSLLSARWRVEKTEEGINSE